MGFTNPIPPFTLIGIGTTFLQPPAVFLETNIMAISRYPSILLVPAWKPAAGIGPGFTTLTVTWYGDPLGFVTLGTENHAIPPYRLPQILTQVKGPFAMVSMGYTAGDTATLDVYSNDTQVQGAERLDSDQGLLVNFAGVAGVAISIPKNGLSGSDLLIGVAKNTAPMLVCQVTALAGVTTTTTITVAADLTVPNGFNAIIDLGTVTTAPITTPTTAGGSVFTKPIALPPVPSGGVPFDLACTATVAAADPNRGYSVEPYVY